jgi:hypothetical protein
MTFDNLPTAAQSALIDKYLMGASPHAEPATAWMAERFFRTLDTAHIAIWLSK